MAQAKTAQKQQVIASKFFLYLFGREHGILCIGRKHKDTGKFEQRFFNYPTDADPRGDDEPSVIDEHVGKITFTHEVWFGVNLLKTRERLKENCMPGSLVWCDLDYANPDNVNPPASCTLETSPSRYQSFWRLSEKVSPEIQQEFSRKIAYATKDADKGGWALTKLLRVPGTFNHKYDVPQEVKLLTAHGTLVPVSIFDELPEPVAEDTPEGESLVEESMPVDSDLPKLENIIYAYQGRITHEDTFQKLFSTKPAESEDWSKLLWHLINICIESGMSKEETFVVTVHSACNKYTRDNRPSTTLWKDISKAYLRHTRSVIITGGRYVELVMPMLVDPDTIEEDSFVADYKKWGEVATDAPMQYHELSCFMALSALISAGLYLKTSFTENMVPNLWGLVLGESTLTRKTTSMRMAMDIITDLDESLILATDGSPEGLMTGISTRPRMVSVFYKDEVAGFFNSINKKDYLTGFPETLTQLYDVPKVLTRLLRKEVITVTEPYFIFFGGGIRDKVYSALDEEYILSGFIPRFLVVSGENDMSRIRRTGPPTEGTWDLKQKVINSMGELRINYNVSAPMEVAGGQVFMPARVEAKLTEQAWQTYGDFEMELINSANKSVMAVMALPTFQRLAFSMLKMATLIAATRREVAPNNVLYIEESDIRQAAFYIQKWGKHSVDLISNAGRPQFEKLLMSVYDFVKVRGGPGVSRSMVMQAFHLQSREAKEIINTLDERGLVEISRVGRGMKLKAVA